MNLLQLSCTGLLSLIIGGAVAANERLPLPLTLKDLTTIAFDGAKAHEALPAGVPSSYDWYKGPRIGAGNNATDFQAATGWGQTFYTKDTLANSRSIFLVKDFRTLVCTNTPTGKEWALVQHGPVEGRQFRADFVGNISHQASTFSTTGDLSQVEFSPGAAFHFWPKSGRFQLESSNLCGFLVYLQAKQISGPPQSIVLGLGADYWTTKTALWDNYRTNKDVAIGRLRVLTSEWQVIGLTTALGDALKVLQESGYLDLSSGTGRSK